MTLLTVKDLNLKFDTDEGRITAVEKRFIRNQCW